MNKHSFRDIAIVGGTMIAMTLVLPVIDSVSSLIQSVINVKINQMQLGLELDTKEAQAAAEIIQPSYTNTQAIGFQIPTETEEEYYDE